MPSDLSMEIQRVATALSAEARRERGGTAGRKRTATETNVRAKKDWEADRLITNWTVQTRGCSTETIWAVAILHIQVGKVETAALPKPSHRPNADSSVWLKSHLEEVMDVRA